MFESFEMLCQHRRVHGDGKVFICPLCGVSVAKKAGLAAHMKVHRETETFRCTKCFKLCANKEEFEKHEKLHAGKFYYTY